MSQDQPFEIRCPVHGFVSLSAWEREIIDQKAFQRLRRIRQLAWTDEVYPGAMHTRFEHSLGVMHVATLLFESVVRNSMELLEGELGYNDSGVARHRQLVRLAALLHDVGHSPFSHASEDLFPDRGNGKKFVHEEYSAAIIRGPLRDVIENHKANANYEFSADDVAALIEGSSSAQTSIFWRDLISGQMDADRMDYLLRDSHHTGVHYGRYDLHRLIGTVTALRPGEDLGLRIGIQEGGSHVAEALVLARYFMFTQVYFHKARVAYDIHIREAMKELLPGKRFPMPSDLGEYLAWDDWRVLGLLAEGKGGEHGARLSERKHYRRVYRSAEMMDDAERERLELVAEKLGDLVAERVPAGRSKNWYKTDGSDIPVLEEQSGRSRPLSDFSNAVRYLGKHDQVFLYASPENRSEADKIVKEVLKYGVE
jgi:HD superfamily phosphohydrolase